MKAGGPPPDKNGWKAMCRAGFAFWFNDVVFIGAGTVVNVITVLTGASIGLALGDRLSERAKDTIMSVLGLFTLVMGGFSVLSMTSTALTSAIGKAASLTVLTALLLGSLLGSWLRIEDRLERGSTWPWIQNRLHGSGDAARFADGLVTSALVFCAGPLALMGSLSDGLGRGPEQLLVKSVLDGFSALAFASALGWGVLASAAAVGLVQGALTLLGYLAGDVLGAAQIDALTATGGVILLGLGVRLLGLKRIPVGDLLPALALAPGLVWIADLFMN